MTANKSRNWKDIWGYTGCFIVDSQGTKVGLMLLWKGGLDIHIKSFSMSHIDCSIRDGDKIWRFTGFYGHPETRYRNLSWDLIRRLSGITKLKGLPWLIGGDFNEICYAAEKLGGCPRPQLQMDAFRRVLDDCELRDLGCNGEFFTWANNRKSNALIFERLDRFVGTFEWCLLYTAARIKSLDFYHSDHRPILLDLNQKYHGDNLTSQKKQHIFRFESCWLLETDCEEVVAKGWNNVDARASLTERIMACNTELELWAADKFRALPKKIQTARKELFSLKTPGTWENNGARIEELEKLIEKLTSQEELYWKQRSRVNWLKHGDRNSKYFHSQASQRRAKNAIDGLISAHGDLCTDFRGMLEIISDYFHNLLTSCRPSAQDIQDVIGSLKAKNDTHMNTLLCLPFSEEEVKRALFDMNPNKSPGPDGMPDLSSKNSGILSARM